MTVCNSLIVVLFLNKLPDRQLEMSTATSKAKLPARQFGEKKYYCQTATNCQKLPSDNSFIIMDECTYT